MSAIKGSISYKYSARGLQGSTTRFDPGSKEFGISGLGVQGLRLKSLRSLVSGVRFWEKVGIGFHDQALNQVKLQLCVQESVFKGAEPPTASTMLLKLTRQAT